MKSNKLNEVPFPETVEVKCVTLYIQKWFQQFTWLVDRTWVQWKCASIEMRM